MFVFFEKHPMKGALRNDLLNVISNIEQILSFELIERTDFQETFHCIDMCSISSDKNIGMTHILFS